MLLDAPGTPLRAAEVADPEPGDGEVLVAVRACGVCRTDLHVRDGELTPSHAPLVCGHQIVGEVLAAGAGAGHAPGARVGIPWLGWTCGECAYCRSGRENLCVRAQFTGLDRDGGYAEPARRRRPLRLPAAGGLRRPRGGAAAVRRADRPPRAADDRRRPAPRASTASARARTSSARSPRHQGRRVFAFVRDGDEAAAAFARELGAEWAGDALGPAPEQLDAAIIFAPAGELVPAALRAPSRRAARWSAPGST